jgi:YQGE family putative transporter
LHHSLPLAGSFKTRRAPVLFILNFTAFGIMLLAMAALKGVAQGFVIAAPVMLIMKLVGSEGSVGSIQSAGALLSAAMLYVLGRATSSKHRNNYFYRGVGLVCYWCPYKYAFV